MEICFYCKYFDGCTMVYGDNAGYLACNSKSCILSVLGIEFYMFAQRGYINKMDASYFKWNPALVLVVVCHISGPYKKIILFKLW